MTAGELWDLWKDFPEALVETIEGTIQSYHDRDVETPVEVLRRALQHVVEIRTVIAEGGLEEQASLVLESTAAVVGIVWVCKGMRAASGVAGLVRTREV